ncbi:MAG: CobW family GTP-binding protein [Burkholderiaceae bacterium]
MTGTTDLDTPLPVTIIGGYLGSGKTTLVNALLQQAQPDAANAKAGLRVAVLVNDFGDIAIDASLIESADKNVMQLAGGCVCCTIGSDLVSTIVSLRETMTQIDHVLVETSGVALPGTVAATIRIATGIQPNGVLVLADALNLKRQRADNYIGDTIDRQLAAGDLIVLSKTDLLTTNDAQAQHRQLQLEWPSARVLTATQGKLPLQVILGLGPTTDQRSEQQNEQTTEQTKKSNSRSQIRTFAPGKDHGSQYLSLSFHSDSSCNLDALAELLSDPENHIVRGKGFVRDAQGKAYVVQSVSSQVDFRLLDELPENLLLVIIGLRQRLYASGVADQLSALGFTSDRKFSQAS